MTAPRVTVESADLFERHVPFRTPFRFGIVTLTEAPQIFLRLRLRLEGGRSAEGQAAEMLAPKWFDKTPDLTNEQNFDQLRRSLRLAVALFLDAEPGTAFGLQATLAAPHQAACAAEGLNPLIASFGMALMDRAVIDGLARTESTTVFAATRANLMGIDAATAPDLAAYDLGGFLATLTPAASIEARHTVGMLDAIREADIAPEARLADGLPQSLEAVIAAYGQRAFKLKLSGETVADLDRLARIADLLDTLPDPYRVTLDGNEQYPDAEAALAFLNRMGGEPRLARLMASILYIEQPIARARALGHSVAPLAAIRPVAIDESDASIAAFPEARAQGYRGISSKSCKGFYRSVLNRARAEMWNAAEPGAGYFLTAEDLTTQPGIALQQDLALATLIGCPHVERNGHHYVDGMAGAPAGEQARWQAAHPDLYHLASGHLRLTIGNGRIALESLARARGLGADTAPDWGSMAESPRPEPVPRKA